MIRIDGKTYRVIGRAPEHVPPMRQTALQVYPTRTVYHFAADGIQLCTDDFAGHLAHNANLSIKAILALGGYAMLCDVARKHDEAERYKKVAGEFAIKWTKMADDGDHYRLAFDKAGTWSQKYNLVWDKLLGLNLFSRDVARREIAFYLTKQNRYGLPLDNRKTYTKLDWVTWTATLADSPGGFEALIAPMYDFANQSR